MGPTVSVTLADLVDETLEMLYRYEERPAQTLTTTTMTAASTTVEVGDATLFTATDLIEIEREILLVTAVSSPELTVSRGYGGTPVNSAVGTGVEVRKSPRWGRYKVARQIQRSLGSIETTVYPVESEEYTIGATTKLFLELPANTAWVENVRYQDTTTGRLVDVGGWEFHYNLPTTVAAGGVALQLPSTVAEDDVIIVSRRTNYAWTDTSAGDGSTTTSPEEDDTVLLPVAGRDLPVLYAAASLALGKEATRQDLDRIEEWSEEAARAQGVNLRTVRDLWGTYYRRLDEVQRTYPMRAHRPYQKMPRI